MKVRKKIINYHINRLEWLFEFILPNYQFSHFKSKYNNELRDIFI